jgi:molybdate transport system substrate-binding protein
VALKETGVWPPVKERLVYAQSAAQAFQFGQEAAAGAFTALSLALGAQGKKGSYWLLDEAPPVIQKGCVLNTAKAREEARRFLAFLLHNPRARAILRASGYE